MTILHNFLIIYILDLPLKYIPFSAFISSLIPYLKTFSTDVLWTWVQVENKWELTWWVFKEANFLRWMLDRSSNLEKCDYSVMPTRPNCVNYIETKQTLYSALQLWHN